MPLDLHSMSKAADGGARVEAAENRDAEDGARLQEVGARLAAAGERAARPPSATARDILADWADWAAEAGCAASRRGILQRGQRLARLLEGGVDLNSAPRRAAARRRSSDFGAPSAPEGLAARIVERVTWLFPPAGIVDDGRARIYVVPYWLVHPQPERRLGAIHVRIGAAASEFRIVDGETRAPPPMDVMRSIALRRKRPADGRRDSMVRVARVLAAELEFILGAAPPADGWLRWAARAPREAERFAVGVWNAFVADCGAPESFRLPGRSLRLHELAILRDAGDRRGDRLWFADQQPWAARALMQSPFGEGKFREIQVNRANAVGISAKLLCCCGREDCDKAKRLARRMPRYRAVADLDFVFGDPERQADSQARALLFEVLEKDGVGAFDRVVENPRLARRQLDRSVETALAGLEAAPNVGYTMGAILFRTMLWSRFDPAEVDCGALARAGGGLRRFARRVRGAAAFGPGVPDARRQGRPRRRHAGVSQSRGRRGAAHPDGTAAYEFRNRGGAGGGAQSRDRLDAVRRGMARASRASRGDGQGGYGRGGDRLSEGRGRAGERGRADAELSARGVVPGRCAPR